MRLKTYMFDHIKNVVKRPNLYFLCPLSNRANSTKYATHSCSLYTVNTNYILITRFKEIFSLNFKKCYTLSY